MTRKSVLRSVRLDDDVWDAVKAMDQSLNQFLRDVLINGIGITDDAEKIKQAMDRGEFDKPTTAERELKVEYDVE